MAWEKTHSINAKNISKKQIWKVWEDVDQWHQWDLDIDYARLNGTFSQGSTFLLKPKAGPKVKIKLIKVLPEFAFTDVTKFPFAKMYGIHEMKDTSEGLEVKHTVRIEGPLSFLWKKLVAEKVAAGISDQAEKMIMRAREIKLND